MPKTIKIFLGSSVLEFKNERMDIENFIFRLSRQFEKAYHISIEPLLCEGFDDAYSKIRKQEEYNEKVRGSDFCFFIFFTKAGEFTREEFEVARKQFEDSGKPKIYTYFKELGDETAEESLFAFMNELEREFGHYYSTFEHIDTVKLRILLHLKLQEMDFLEIRMDGDACLVDGKKALSLANVPAFANNRLFLEMKQELMEVEERYFALKARYEARTATPEEERDYIEIATKRQTLIDGIEELQKHIFNMSLRICQDEERGEITLRQREAYRLFEAGDLEGANRILDFAEMKNDYQRRTAIRKAEQKKDAAIFVREGRTKIDVLTAMHHLSTRFEEIEAIYDEITAVALEEQVELDTVIDFAWFLWEQNKQTKAYDIAKQAIALADGDEQTARLYHLLGVACSDMTGHSAEAAEYYRQAIAIWERLAAGNPERFESALAGIYNNAGVFYDDQGQPALAEEYYRKAIAIHERLAAGNPERFEPDLADSYNNAGVFYKNQGQPALAEEYYRKAIAIYERLAAGNSDRFEPDLAMSYNNTGVFYKNQGQPALAEKYYRKAIAIYERLAAGNPARFEPDLAMSYNNAGAFYNDQGQPTQAEEYYRKAIAIRERLAAGNPERFEPDLAMSYNNAGAFYNDQGQPTQAEEYYRKAIAIRERLAAGNPERFEPELAGSYNNAGVFYVDQGQPTQAEGYYRKAIAIYERLAVGNPERFEPDLAMSCNNAGNFYDDQGQPTQAEEYYRKAIAIRERLAAGNPERFEPALAMSYNNAGVFYKNQGQPALAEEYYRKAIAIRERLAAGNPDRFEPALAMSYNNAGAFYKNQGQPALAEEYYRKAIAIRERLAAGNPDRFEPVLAVSYYNYGLFSKDNAWGEKALALAKKHPDHPMCRRLIQALT